MWSVHRLAYTVLFGKPVLPGIRVLHKCPYKHCFNPRHLYVGTDKDNCADRRSYRGIGNPNARLKQSDLPKIVSLAENGIKHKDIGKAFGVSKSTIAQFLQGRTWGNLKKELK